MSVPENTFLHAAKFYEKNIIISIRFRQKKVVIFKQQMHAAATAAFQGPSNEN